MFPPLSLLLLFWFSLRLTLRSLRLCVEYAFLFDTGFAELGRGRERTPLTPCYTGSKHGCQFGINGDERNRARGPPGCPRVPAVLHPRETVDQRSPRAALPRAGPHFFGAGTRRLVPGAVSLLWLRCLHRSRRQCAGCVRRAAVRGAHRPPRYRAGAAPCRAYLAGPWRPLP